MNVEDIEVDVQIVQISELGPLDGRHLVRVSIFTEDEDSEGELLCTPNMARQLASKLICRAVQVEQLQEDYLSGDS